MQYEATSPTEYLEKLDEDWRKEKLVKIRDLILQQSSGSIQESIEYKMLRLGDDSSSIFHLNAQKNYVALYVGDISKVDPSGELLKGYDTGKGCIRIKRKDDAGDEALVEFIKLAIQKWQEGKDLSC